MPAKATLFNGKCEAVYEFGTGPRNECFFSPHGNAVCLAGFGNLRGRIEVWNLSSSNRVPQVKRYSNRIIYISTLIVTFVLMTLASFHLT